MNNNTALIVRSESKSSVRVLEVDGPHDFAPVHRSPMTFLFPCLSFEEFKALPEHLKKREPDAYDIDYASASRIARLLFTAEYSGSIWPAHMREIRWRMESLFPGCGDIEIRSEKRSA